jgi:hypothetical protein
MLDGVKFCAFCAVLGVRCGPRGHVRGSTACRAGSARDRGGRFDPPGTRSAQPIRRQKDRERVRMTTKNRPYLVRVLARSGHADGAGPVVVEVAELEGEHLDVVRTQACRVVDHMVVRRRHCPLSEPARQNRTEDDRRAKAGTHLLDRLAHEEEVVPAAVRAARVHHRPRRRIRQSVCCAAASAHRATHTQQRGRGGRQRGRKKSGYGTWQRAGCGCAS